MRVPGCQRTTRERGLIFSTSSSGRSARSATLYHLIEVHVVEAGAVLQEVNDAHRELRLPGVVDLNLRGQRGHRGVEVERVVQVHLHERRGDEGLTDRPGAEVRIGGHRRLLIAIGEPHPTGPFNTGHPDERDAGARNTGLAQDDLDGLSKVLDGLRPRIGIGALRRKDPHETQKEEADEGPHGREYMELRVKS